MKYVNLHLASLLSLFNPSNANQNFTVFYGNPSPIWNELSHLNFVILEPNHPNLVLPADSTTKWIAYLSLGEVHQSRSYYPNIADKSWVLSENKDWTGARRIDPRSLEWKDFILNHLIPELRNAGWGGLFFDTVDVGPWLEQTDSTQYKGAKNAMADLIRSIHLAWPEAFLVMNNGYELLPEIAPVLDVILLEGLNTRWDFDRKIYTKSPESERQRRIQRSQESLLKSPLTQVWILDYSATNQDKLARYARKEWKKLGWHGTLSDLSLQRWKCIP